MPAKKILVVDDDRSIIKFVKAHLDANGFKVLTARDGDEALKVIEGEYPDLILLDIMMSAMDGYEVCRRVRDFSPVPIIMISARCDEPDKVECLNLGADDYLCKPFGLDELLARIQAVLRRVSSATITKPAKSAFTSGELEINFVERCVRIAGVEVGLTLTEYKLLQEMAINSPKVLTFQLLLRRVWGPEFNDERQYLHIYIARLRRKLEIDSQNPAHIISVRDVGYRLI